MNEPLFYVSLLGLIVFAIAIAALGFAIGYIWRRRPPN